MRAETYVWIDDPRELEDGEWDFEEFVREKLRNWVGVKAGEIEGESEFGSTAGSEGEERKKSAEGKIWEERASFRGAWRLVPSFLHMGKKSRFSEG